MSWPRRCTQLLTHTQGVTPGWMQFVEKTFSAGDRILSQGDQVRVRQLSAAAESAVADARNVDIEKWPIESFQIVAVHKSRGGGRRQSFTVEFCDRSGSE